MSDRSNVGQRLLNPRKCLHGPQDSLEGTFGKTLPWGAKCFVIEEQATYAFLLDSELHADGRFVVMPVDRQGRWVREQGLVGFASLRGGRPSPEDLIFTRYEHEQLVQFASSPDGRVVYTGAVPRSAMIVGQAQVPERVIAIVVEPGDGSMARSQSGYPEVVNLATILVPGDKVSLAAAAVPSQDMVASLFIVLQ